MSRSDGSDESTASGEPIPGSWRSVVLLTFASILSFMDRSILNLLVEPIKRDFLLSDTQIGLLVGIAFALVYVVAGLPFGWLADRISRRWILFSGVMLWSVATVGCGLARNFWQLFSARAGVGIGEATLTPCAHSLISDLFPRRSLARALAVYATGSNIGAGLALLIGGHVVVAVSAMPPIEIPFIGIIRPWQAAFVTVGMPGMLLALLMLTLRERRRLPAPLVQRDVGTPATMPEESFISLLRVQRRFYVPLLASFALIASMSYGMATWIPSLLVRRFDWTLDEVGFAYGMIILIGGTSGTLLGGVLADALKARKCADACLRVSFIAMIVALPCALVAPIAPSGGWTLFFVAPYWFLAAMPIALFPAALQEVTPSAFRARIAALSVFCVNLLGLSAGPMIVALLTDYLFAAEGKLNMSLLVMASVCMPLALLGAWFAGRAFVAPTEVGKS
ncbi:MFS transporter [uncultured Sphingosinicella sp.]|uniref:spinster family MFS transporter n=1 Tax=uncultured Sphingosinicella sp. TaxID=478748 RepID=UPI0030DC7F16|tara:strand:+ start:11925 stop:13277 length:1353 start_codon:yes stop_codon:yes gene_type:complete